MLARRAVIRAVPRTRGYANTAELAKTSYHEKQAALASHAGGALAGNFEYRRRC